MYVLLTLHILISWNPVKAKPYQSLITLYYNQADIFIRQT